MLEGRTLADGRYRLADPLGEGATAVVYRAQDLQTGREVAIKILAPALARHLAMHKRFEREASALERLDHPHIVRILGVGQDDRLAYIVMELVPGGSTIEWVQRHGPMPPRLAVGLLLQACDALGAAHAAGLVHRDLKPHNLLLAADGGVRVADFGITRVLDQSSMTRTGVRMGTMGFMAPEQAENAKQVDLRADIYSLGATLFSLVSGLVPEDIREQLDGGALAAPLIHPVTRATMTNPAHRWESTRRFARALEAAMDELPEVPADAPPLGLTPPPSPGQGPTLLPMDVGNTWLD